MTPEEFSEAKRIVAGAQAGDCGGIGITLIEAMVRTGFASTREKLKRWLCEVADSCWERYAPLPNEDGADE